MSIIVMTNRHDYSVDQTVKALSARGLEVFRFDTAEFPSRSKLCFSMETPNQSWTLSTPSRSVSLDQVTSVWYRHPTPFQVHQNSPEPVRAFVVDECRAALGGALRSLRCTWVDHPEKIISADYKPYQLTVAKRLGLRIPPTLITNDPEEVLDFYGSADGPVIYKAMTQAAFVEGSDVEFVYTNVLSAEDMEQIHRVTHAPCLFQYLIPKAYELRITVIGSNIFAARLYSQESESAKVDYRLGYAEIGYDYHTLPESLRNRIRELMHVLGLQYGAIDMVVTPEGEYVFLEINPSGQFGWIEEKLEFPMTEAFVELLSGQEV